MSKPNILKILKKKHPGISKKQIQDIFEGFFSNITKSLIHSQSIEIKSLGRFFVKVTKPKKNARNPKTGEKILYIDEKRKVRFKASKNLMNILNNKK